MTLFGALVLLALYPDGENAFGILVLAQAYAHEFTDQPWAIRRHGDTMKAILKKHPAQRMVEHYEPGWIPDIPHYLVYDTTDPDVAAVIVAYRRRFRDVADCTITGGTLEPHFFELEIDC